MAPSAFRLRSLVAYAVIAVGTLVGLYLVYLEGRGLEAPSPGPTPRFGTGTAEFQVNVLLHALLALAVIIIFSHSIGLLFRRFRQPLVIGEVVAGILLGPSLLGALAPEAYAYLLPPSVSPFLSVLAQVGIILYMFLVGVEFDPTPLRSRTEATILVSHASIMVPFFLGTVLALVLYPRLSTTDVPFSRFALFIGVSMAITAFPVLARILSDRSMQRTSLGVMALSCAAVNDVTAWCMLAFLVSIVQLRLGGAFLTVAMTGFFIAIMIVAVRPLVIRLVLRQETWGLTRGAMTIIILGLILSSLASESIGIHAIFGAFLLGTLIPHDSMVAHQLRIKLEDLVVVLFLPIYFVYTGLRTQISLVSGTEQWLLCLLIILVASAGKFGGSLLAARLTGMGWRESSALGILLNTRGLMELIVLNIGMDLRVISPTLFAMLVIMAVATTLTTVPLLQLLKGFPEEGAMTRTAGGQPEVRDAAGRRTSAPHVSR